MPGIRLVGPLDLHATLYSGQAFRWRPGPEGWHHGFIHNGPVRVRLEGSTLRWDAHDTLTTKQVRSYFRLDDSHDAFIAAAPEDPFLQTALQRFAGLRLLRQDPWETFISFLLSQNSNEARIRRTIEALCEAAGETLEWRGRQHNRFPTPRQVERLSIPQLRGLGMGYRAPYIAQATRIVLDGLDVNALPHETYEHAFERLLQVPGIGPKVADCILLYGCDHRRAFPSDVWVRRFIAETYLRRRRSRPSHETIRAFAWRRFGEEAGYAQHFLFHYRRAVGRLAANES